MPRPVVCPHCGEELDIPVAFRDREVRCASCRNTFLPTASVEELQPAFDTGSRLTGDRDDASPRTRDSDDEFEPRQRPRRKSGGNTWLWVLLIGGFGCCGLSCGGFLLFGLYVAFPDFQSFDSAEGRFHAEFPGTPTQFADADDERRPRQNIEFRRKFPPETYFVRYVDLTADPADEDAVLDAAADDVVKDRAGSREVTRSEPKTVGGYPAVDVTLENADSSMTVSRAVLVGRRLYVIGMTGGGLHWDTPHVQHFMEAFRATHGGAVGIPARKNLQDEQPPKAKK